MGPTQTDTRSSASVAVYLFCINPTSISKRCIVSRRFSESKCFCKLTIIICDIDVVSAVPYIYPFRSSRMSHKRKCIIFFILWDIIINSEQNASTSCFTGVGEVECFKERTTLIFISCVNILCTSFSSLWYIVHYKPGFCKTKRSTVKFILLEQMPLLNSRSAHTSTLLASLNIFFTRSI